jgi:hypothetical protein
MQYLIIGMLIVATLMSYLVKTLHLPRQMMLTPEAFSAIALLIVVARLPKNRLSEVEPRYLALFVLLILHLVAGMVVNDEPAGVVISGIRIYLKFMPFFVLPLLIPQTEKALKWQFLVLAGICLLQFPLAWDQRSAGMFKGSLTGDRTVGTMGISANLSILLCCAAAVALALHLRQKLKLWHLIVFLAATLPATMINETKATLLIAPFALAVPAMFAGASSQAGKMKRMMVGALLIVGFLGAFIPTYDYYIEQRWGYGLIDFFTMKGRVEKYLDKSAGLGSQEVGRVDSMVLPFVAAKHDPTQAAFGLGAGNVSSSSLGPGFMGEQYYRYGNLVGPTASRLLWEIGWVGLALVLCLHFMIFRDALVARHAEGLAGALGLGWIAVASIIGLTMFYNVAMQNDGLSYLFWFYSGVVVATASRVRREQATEIERERARARRDAAFGVPVPARPFGPVAGVRRSARSP